jgi:hypothetical protein
MIVTDMTTVASSLAWTRAVRGNAGNAGRAEWDLPQPERVSRGASPARSLKSHDTP